MSGTRGTIAMIGACLVFFTIGISTVWGTILPYFSNYLRYHGNPDIKDHSFNIVGPIQSLFTFVGQNLSIPLANRFGSRKAIFLGLLLMSSGLFITYRTTNIYMFTIAFSCIQGIGVGITYISPISIAANYFPERKGTMTGILLGFYGFSGIMIQVLFN